MPITVTTEAGPIAVRLHTSTRAVLNLVGPERKGVKLTSGAGHAFPVDGPSQLTLEAGSVTAADVDHPRVTRWIGENIDEPNLTHTQIAALDSADRVALVEAILGGGAK